MTIAAVMIGFLKRSQKKRVSSATSRDGGGAVGINVVCWINLKPAEFVLCHAKVSRASIGEWARPRDNALSGDKILAMNAFWNSFETLLGLGVEPKNLTFIQISLRGVIVFVVTLITMQLGHKRSLSRKTPFDAALLVFLQQCFRARLMVRQLFRYPWWRSGFGAAPSSLRVSGGRSVRTFNY